MTSDSIIRTENNMAAIKAYIEAEAGASKQSVLGRTSQFWQSEFEGRPNFPTLSEYLAFRRGGFTQGMADSFSYTSNGRHDVEQERAHARSTYEIFRHCAPPDRIIQLDESTLGAPFIFEHHGVSRSASFWTNAATALRVKDIVDKRGLPGRSLNILEIGAGWGCVAHQLHQLLDVNSYTIVDLPQNLLLSSTYISSILGRKLLFARCGDIAVQAEPQSLLCALPGAASAIVQKYDIVVNTFSLQEMDLETVQEYFAWVSSALADDGVFISFNSHGKAGVRLPCDYPLQAFHLEHLGMFRDYPAGLLNTIPYEMVLSLRKTRPAVDPLLLNVICLLMQFGLGDDLKLVCAQFVGSELPGEAQRALTDIAPYFSLSGDRRAAALAKTAGTLPPALHAYLRGMDSFMKKDPDAAKAAFTEALDRGLKGFAHLRASAHLAILMGQTMLPRWDVDFDARLAYPELARILDEKNSSQFIGQFERIVAAGLPMI